MAIKRKKTGQLYPTVGMLGDRAILRWDPATRCDDRCCVYDDCPYEKGGKCRLEVKYMNNIFDNLISCDPERGIGDLCNDVELQRVGLHLIPLYHQLIRMKKEAYSVQRISHVNKQGSIKIHPVFAEIREILRCIGKEIRDLGVNDKWKKKYGGVAPVGGQGQSMEELLERGDPGYYESMSQDEES